MAAFEALVRAPARAASRSRDPRPARVLEPELRRDGGDAGPAARDRDPGRGRPGAAAGRRACRLRILDLGTGSGCCCWPCCRAAAGLEAWASTLRAGPQSPVAAATRPARGLGSRRAPPSAVGDWAAPRAGMASNCRSQSALCRRTERSRISRPRPGYDPRQALDGGPDGLDAYRRPSASRPRVAGPGRAAGPRGRRRASGRGRGAAGGAGFAQETAFPTSPAVRAPSRATPFQMVEISGKNGWKAANPAARVTHRPGPCAVEAFRAPTKGARDPKA